MYEQIIYMQNDHATNAKEMILTNETNTDSQNI